MNQILNGKLKGNKQYSGEDNGYKNRYYQS